MNFSEELALNLKSDYPIIFISAFEEQSVIPEVRRACELADRECIVQRAPGELVDIPHQIQTLTTGKVLLLTEVSARLEEPDAIRLLSDLDLKSAGSVVVIVPWISIPAELERISAIMEYPLPTVEKLRAVLDDVCAQTAVLLMAEDTDAMIRVSQGLTEGEARRAFRKALLGWPEASVEARAAVEREKRKALLRSNVLEHVDVDAGLMDVGGMNMLKSWLKSRKSAFTEEARAFGLPVPRGLLLMGIQGCGKSLAAKAVAGFWELPLVRLDVSAIFGQRHPEESLRSALKIAEAMAPLILWIDEIEKGFDNEFKGTEARLLGGLITWLQEKKKEVFVVATANKVDALPPELPRKGRFDEIFFVDLPDAKERKDILALHMKKRGLNPEQYDLTSLLAKTEKFTGSELEQLVISAMYLAFERHETVTDADFRRALSQNVTLYETFEPQIKTMREWARKRARMASSDRSKVDYFDR
ncbi:MAG: AAA family ATPase [Deltaproteobacteria bacterium]|nr:AAA family ATPase [Deltaproteobacteria bacterium]